MKTKLSKLFALWIILALIPAGTGDTAVKTISLLKPQSSGGIPLMDALSKRSSSRTFSDTPLSDQVLSNLLWAAFGINRADSGKRTAPSALNRQEIDVYVILKNGAYIYNAEKNQLVLITDKDISSLTGRQGFVSDAAVNLVYVADLDKSAGEVIEEKMMYSGAAAGFIGQNVYLFCVSEGLNTVIRAYIDREKLGKVLKIRANQKIILAQTVGYPAEKK